MNSDKRKKVSVIVPAFNEEFRIGRVLKILKKVPEIDEIIVVDDGSEDDTVKVSEKFGVRVLKHLRNKGKGEAVKTGIRSAVNDAIVLFDADLESLTVKRVQKLILPLKNNEVDFVKAAYSSEQGRVTKLVAKPLMKILFPKLKLKYPLSGEFGFLRSKFQVESIESGWGMDIQFAIQAMRRGMRLKEVHLGIKKHKHQTLDALGKMSSEVIRTILAEAKVISHKYQLICFDLDKTLISGSSIELIADEWGFTDELEELKKSVKDKNMLDYKITKTLVKHFKGKNRRDVTEVCEKMVIRPFAKEVIKILRAQRYKVRIISAAYSPVVGYFSRELDVPDFFCPRLEKDEDGVYTGKLLDEGFIDNGDCGCGLYVCKRKVVKSLRKNLDIHIAETLAIGDGKSDRCMFDESNFSLGLRTSLGDQHIDNLSEVLVYLDT